MKLIKWIGAVSLISTTFAASMWILYFSIFGVGPIDFYSPPAFFITLWFISFCTFLTGLNCE